MSGATPGRDLVDRSLDVWLREFPDLDLATEGLVARIHKLSRYIEKTLGDTAAEFGLTIWDWELVAALRREGEPYSAKPTRLAEHLNVSPGGMTSRIDRLEAQGLVTRRPDPEDRRVVRVELTNKGLAMWEEAVGVQAAKEKMVADALTRSEKEAVNDLLRKLMLSLEALEGPPPTRASLRPPEGG